MTVAAFFLNVFRDGCGSLNEPPDKSYVELVGKVQQKELKTDYLGEDISVIYLIPTGQEKRDFEMVQCYLDPSLNTVPSIGEYVKVSGKVKTFSHPTNPGEFDSYLYYSTLKISYRLNNVKILESGGKISWYKEGLYRVKIYFEKVLDSILSSQDAAIMKAMLLGDKAFLDEETKDMYKNSGIMHTLAVSGLHISIIGMGLYRLLMAFMKVIAGYVASINPGRKKGTIRAIIWKMLPTGISILVMYSYGVMCGMGTSSFRAICMFILRLLAPVAGRTYDILSALALAEILLLLDQPLYLYNSGFLFSFGAVIGITVIKPALKPKGKYLEEKMRFVDDKERQALLAFCKRAVLKVADALHTGLSIALATLPVYALFYYTYPVHSIVLNLVVIPLMSILMLAGITAMLLGGIFPLLGYLPGFIVHGILYLYKMISSVNSVNGKFTWYLGHSENYQVASYLALILVFIAVSNMQGTKGILEIKIGKRKLKLSQKRMDAIRSLILVASVVVLTFRTHPDLEINMIDVGQGDGIVISSAGHNILIDGGSTTKKNVGKYQIIPFLKYKGIGKLDAAIVTHEDEDHISGLLEIMDDMEKGGIRIKKLILPEVSDSSRGDNYHKLEARAIELNISIAYINTEESFSLGKAEFICLNPRLHMNTDGANAYSTVLFMRYERFTALFTGDMEGEGLEHVKDQLRSSDFKDQGGIDLLKVAHHGSQYTTDEEFLELTRPKIAIISCGLNNTYGHPHKELLQRLEQVGSNVFRTDKSGCIIVEIHGTSLSVSKYLDGNY